MDRAIETIVRVFGAESVTDITTEAITNEVVAR